MKTYSAKVSEIDKQWILVDAEDIVLGRLADEIATRLRGKHKPNFTPHVDCGDNIIVLNSDKIILTGQKWKQKQYIRHTGYPGGQRNLSAEQIHKKNNTRLIEKSIKGMLPKNKLGAELFRNLRVYPGDQHQQEGQNPTNININDLL